MSITTTGDQLNILISCNYSLLHDWMSFASWYSISQNLPDAQVTLLCSREYPLNQVIFNWPFRAGIRYFQHKKQGTLLDNQLYAAYSALELGFIQQPFFVINPEMMCIRSFSKSLVRNLNDDTKFSYQDGFLYFNDQPIEFFKKAITSLGSEEKTINTILEETFGANTYLDNCCTAASSDLLTSFIDLKQGFKFYDKNIFEQLENSAFAYLELLGTKIKTNLNSNEKMHLTYKMIK